MRRFLPVAALLPAMMLLNALVWAASAHAMLPTHDSQGEPLPSLAPLVEKASPAVVNISTFTTVTTYANPLLQDPFFRRFFNIPKQRQQQKRRTQSAGSGVIVDAEMGFVLTNNHVVAKADEILVTLHDGRSYPAKLIGTDEQVDLAVLEIEADDLTAIEVADSSTLRVGDFVVAIGNPFGIGQTVTSGIVSAVGRSGLGLLGYEDLIQTDASINPGNSGGALVNLRGELVGINTAILAPAGGNIGIGFAIPTEMASQVMRQLIDFGVVKRGILGILFQDLTPDLADAFAIEGSDGVLISKVVEGSAAAKAGIQAGDVVVAFNGREVKKALDLRNRLGLTPAGDELELVVLREGKRKKIKAVLAVPVQNEADGQQISSFLEGARLENLLIDDAASGVVISALERGSAAVRAGLRAGDIIISANRKETSNLEELRHAISRNDDNLLLRIVRDGSAFFLVIR